MTVRMRSLLKTVHVRGENENTVVRPENHPLKIYLSIIREKFGFVHKK